MTNTDFFNIARNTDLESVKEVIDFDKLPTYMDFMKAFSEICKDRTQTVKDKLRTAGGYQRIVDLADLHYETPFSTIPIVKAGFHHIINLPEAEQVNVKGDSSGYRFKIAERYNLESDYFTFPNDFMVAYNIVCNNSDLVKKAGIA